jgi:hypothetical protein
MNIRAISTGIAFAAALFAGSALAQQQGAVAKLADLEGNVLVSQGDAMVAGSNGQRLPVGTRVVTTAGAKVTVSYDVGCDVRLVENQRFTVNVGACAALLASVEPLGPAAGAIGGGAGAVAGGGTAVALSTGALTGIAVVGIVGLGAYETLKNNKPVSPN